MSVSVLICGFGAVLLLVAIVGGGLELKEIKVPKLGKAARSVSAIAGVIFVFWGIGLSAGEPQTTHPNNVLADAPRAGTEANENIQDQPVEFTVYDNLGDTQITEQVTILLDGKVKGQLTVDLHNSESMLTITVPKKGRYSYSISSRSVIDSDDGTFEVAGTGQGMIDVRPGKVFDLQGSVSGSTWLVTLVERQQE